MHRRSVLRGFLATVAWFVFGTPRVSAEVDALTEAARKLRPLVAPGGARFAGFPLVAVGGVLLSEEEVEHALRLTAGLDKPIGSA